MHTQRREQEVWIRYEKYAKNQLGKELTEDEAAEMYQLKAHYFHEMPTTNIFDGVKDLMLKIQNSGLKNRYCNRKRTTSAYQSLAFRLQRFYRRNTSYHCFRRKTWQTKS